MSIGFYAGSRAYLPRRWRLPAPQVQRGRRDLGVLRRSTPAAVPGRRGCRGAATTSRSVFGQRHRTVDLAVAVEQRHLGDARLGQLTPLLAQPALRVGLVRVGRGRGDVAATRRRPPGARSSSRRVLGQAAWSAGADRYPSAARRAGAASWARVTDLLLARRGRRSGPTMTAPRPSRRVARATAALGSLYPARAVVAGVHGRRPWLRTSRAVRALVIGCCAGWCGDPRCGAAESAAEATACRLSACHRPYGLRPSFGTALAAGVALADAEVDRGTDLLVLSVPGRGCDAALAAYVVLTRHRTGEGAQPRGGRPTVAEGPGWRWPSRCATARLDGAAADPATAGRRCRAHRRSPRLPAARCRLDRRVGLLLRASARRTPVVPRRCRRAAP